MKEIQLFGRFGNKTTDIKYFKDLLPSDIKNVIEPFGGTFALIRNIYNDSKYKKFVNDNDPILYKIYTNPKNYSSLMKDANNLTKKHLNNDNNVIYTDFIKDFEKLDYDQDLKDFWKAEKIIRGRMIKNIKREIKCTETFKLFQNINFSCIDYLDCIKIHYQNKNSFIFLDPPYLFSNNSSYSQQKRKDGEDMTHMLYEILEIFQDKKTKAKIMLIINDMKIIRWMFKDYLKGEYNKIYQIGKRKSNHLIITNYI